MTDSNTILTEMNDRSREVFRRVVEGYLDNGDPVGSRTLTRDFSEKNQCRDNQKRHARPRAYGVIGIAAHQCGAYSNATWFADVCGWTVRGW